MSHTPESELVLTADGRIYHLGLRPEDIGSIILTVGDPERVGRISRHFDRIDVQASKREFHTHTGWLGKHRISVVSTGIGPDNIDIVVNELDALANFDFEQRIVKQELTSLRIIRLGTSGALQEDIEPGSVVVSRFGIGLDNLMYFYQYHNTLSEAELFDALQEFQQYHGLLPIQPYVCESDLYLAQVLGKDLEQGITLTCPGFFGPQGRQWRVPIALPFDNMTPMQHFRFREYRIVNFEMETSALFGLSRLLGHHALSFNVILANRTRQTFTSDPYKAVDGMIETALERIAAL